MNTLGEFLQRKVSGDFGVEIELEGPDIQFHAVERLGEDVRDEWLITSDGSLRGGGVEFVSQMPVAKKSLDKHVKMLYNGLKKAKIKPTISDRTGTHLHINVLELTSTQILNFLSAYYIIEELLIDKCGPNRVGNHFCLRAKDADLVIHRLCQAIRNNDYRVIGQNDIRYAALNLNAMFRHGSLEFRAIQSSLDSEFIPLVAEVLWCLKQKAKEFNSPDDLVNLFSENGGRFVLKYLLGDHAEFLLDNENVNKKVQDGVRLVQDIVFAYLDNPEFNLFGKTTSRKRKSAVSRPHYIIDESGRQEEF